MKVLEKKIKGQGYKGTYDPSLDNLPIPKVVQDKVERAREFLRKYPVPEHLLRNK